MRPTPSRHRELSRPIPGRHTDNERPTVGRLATLPNAVTQSNHDDYLRQRLSPQNQSPHPLQQHQHQQQHQQRKSLNRGRSTQIENLPSASLRSSVNRRNPHRNLRNTDRGYIINEAYHAHHAASLGRLDADRISRASSTKTVNSGKSQEPGLFLFFFFLVAD